MEDLIPKTLLPWEAYKHSMVPGSWVEKHGLEKATQMAKDAQQKFTNDLLDMAKARWDKGDRRQALIYFGRAIHPLMDAESPVHKWQVYDLSGNLNYDVADAIIHARAESRKPTAAEMSAMRGRIQDAFSCVVPQAFYDKATSKYPFVRAR